MSISAADVKALRDRTNAPMMECRNALAEANGDIDSAIKLLRERGIAKAAKRAERGTTEGVVRCEVGAGNRGVTAVMVACETDFSARNEGFQAMAGRALRAAAALPAGPVSVDAALEQVVDGHPFRHHLDEVGNQIRENMKLAEVVRFEGPSGAYVHFDGRSAAIVEVTLGQDGSATSPALAAGLRDLCMHIVAIDPAPLAVNGSDISAELLKQEREIFVKQAMDSGKPREIAEKMVDGRMKKFVAERALLEQPFVKDPSQTAGQFVAALAKSLGTTVAVNRFRRLQIGV